MNSVLQQRLLIDHERRCIIQNSELTSLGGCERHPQQEEDSVFLTPNPSPAFSSDGSAYSGELGYFPTAQGSPNMELQPLPLSSSPTGVYGMGPGSPCEEFGSPYSPPYDNSSPHSLTCSISSHGSPASIACSDNGQYTPYLSPSGSIHDIPASSLPLYTTVPISTPSGFFNDMPQPPWMNGNTLPSFEAFQQGEMHNPAHFVIEGEIPVVTVMNQMQQHRDGAPQIDSDGNHPQLTFYDRSPSGSPNRQMYYHEMAVMVQPEMAPGAMCPPYVKSATKSSRIKKVKPPVEVNDEHIKDIPTSSQLWEFTLRVLKKKEYNYMVNWENRKEGLFRFHDAPAFAALWGKHRNRPNMTYDKVARALRYYYKRDILNQVGGRLTYRFSKRLGKLYAPED